MHERLTVSEAARQITCHTGTVVSFKPITDVFYRRDLDDVCCPFVGCRRLIPADYLAMIVRVLRSRGHVCEED